jgi:hypothetical protein
MAGFPGTKALESEINLKEITRDVAPEAVLEELEATKQGAE